MNNRKILVLVICLITVVVGGGLLAQANTKNEDQTQVSSQPQQSTEPANTEAPLTKAEVAKHSSASDCWTIIDGVVYDITPYVSRHPGGDEILRACGGDGSTLFNQRQTASGEAVGSGTSHSSTAQSQLAQFSLGELAQ